MRAKLLIDYCLEFGNKFIKAGTIVDVKRVYANYLELYSYRATAYSVESLEKSEGEYIQNGIARQNIRVTFDMIKIIDEKNGFLDDTILNGMEP